MKHLLRILILGLLCLSAGQVTACTTNEFISTFGRAPDATEAAWLKCIKPTLVRGGKYAPICYAYMEVPNAQKAFPIPDAWQVAVYGELVPDCTLAGPKQFTIGWTPSVDTNNFIFDISANYNLSPKPPCRSRYTTAQDCEEWKPYFESIGKTMDDVLNQEERSKRLPVIEY